MALPTNKILIVGAGCFGISTAYHLLKRGFTDVTVIDRSEVLPAVDGSSNDFNRNPFYSKLAKEAIKSWKEEVDLWGDSYQESGVLILGSSDTPSGSYADEAYEHDVAQGLRVRKLANPGELRGVFPPQATVSLSRSKGYINYDGGWADAGRATSLMTSKVMSMGGKIIPGKTVKALLRENGKETRGVECVDGTIFEADLVVIATGSWTPSTFPDLGLNGNCLSTGQCVAMTQLTAEEADAYRGCPVLLNFDTGYYCFPPTRSNVMKMAFHRAGYTHKVKGVSTPRTVSTHPENGLAIPKEVVGDFRNHWKDAYPELAKKPFSSTRLCWYNDTPDGDWVIGRHPQDTSLILATGGSGHAFKFLPVIGRIVADAIEGTLDPELTSKFAVDRKFDHGDKSREGQTPQDLHIDQLCTPQDLEAV
ncbi:hypothetical protein VNI00_007455 [Paramarasmius palmivorus]|uniref:FAD dependent oxidoreductase domain-containing protein n=1 Tax=Paramarasmius palmivorus TaxID=297713 RepID=A0AAW0D3P0_9AGAR